jgi:WD40-like Beta Propeller Repeat
VSDTRELLRPGVDGFEPTPDAFERVLVRRGRKRRNRRIAAGIVGIAVFVIAAAGLLRLLGSEPMPAVPPTQPRNGNWIVFSALHLDPDSNAPSWSRGRKASLYVAGLDGVARLLVDSKGEETLACPTFSPDGSLLAYGQQRAGDRMAVVVTGFTPSGELGGPGVRITVPASSNILMPCPAWAPKGRRLATIAPGIGVLFADADGTTNLVPFDDPQLADGVREMEWSPDGTQVAVLLWPTGSGQALWVVSADGGAARRVPGFGEGQEREATAIAWAPDGRSVVVGGSSGPPGCCAQDHPFVEVVDVATGDASDVPLPESWDGSGFLQIVATGTDRFLVMRAGATWLPPEWLDLQGHVTPIGDLEYPPTSFFSLSPDGTQMLYVTYDPTNPSQGQALVAVPIDGGGATRLSPWTPQGFGDNYSTFAWQPR